MAGKGDRNRVTDQDGYGSNYRKIEWSKPINRMVSIHCFCGCTIQTMASELPVTCDRCRTKHEVAK
jgi:hypothetical protein